VFGKLAGSQGIEMTDMSSDGLDAVEAPHIEGAVSLRTGWGRGHNAQLSGHARGNGPITFPTLLKDLPVSERTLRKVVGLLEQVGGKA